MLDAVSNYTTLTNDDDDNDVEAFKVLLGGK